MLLQQREFINSLFNERDCFKGVVFDDDEFVISADNDKFLLLNGQVNSDRQIAEVFAEMGNQNSILMKAEEIVTIEDSKYCEDVFSEEMPKLWHELSVLE